MSPPPSRQLSDSTVDNERVIDELTKDLESHLQTSDDAEAHSSTNPRSQSDSCGSFTIEPDSDANKTRVEFVDDLDKDEDDAVSDEDDEEDCELAAKDAEDTLTPEERESRRVRADIIKSNGNEFFKEGDFKKSIEFYGKGLKICPLSFPKERAMLYCNRAASKMKLNKNKQAIKDCTRAIEYDPTYLKAYFRRAQCYELTESLDESLTDYNKVIELDPQHLEARKATVRLPPLIEERNEKLKTEMMSKLKDLGNLVLRPFGLSTENFKLTQDPETKGYSINFQQNK